MTQKIYYYERGPLAAKDHSLLKVAIMKLTF